MNIPNDRVALVYLQIIYEVGIIYKPTINVQIYILKGVVHIH